MNRIYIVTGAAGHLGSTVIRLLKDKGQEVRGLILPSEKPVITGPEISYFYGDIRDPGCLNKLFEGTEEVTVIHTAAVISIAGKMPPELYNINVNGTKNILTLCRFYHVRRLVYVCSVHAIPKLPMGQTIQEISSFSPDTVTGAYARTKAEAAQAVIEAAAAGLDAVTVFPSGILGPYDKGKNHLIQMVSDYMNGKLPACVRGGYDFADVRDVAEGCLKAAEGGRAGEGYILSGHYRTIRELLSMIGKNCGRKEIPVLPYPLAKAAVPFIEAAAGLCHKRPLYTDYSLRVLQSNAKFSHEKATDELGYLPRSLEETVKDMVQWIRKEND